MSEETFRIVVAAAVLIACLAFVVQAGVVLALYRLTRKMQDRTAGFMEHAEPVLARVEPVLEQVGPVIEKIGPALDAINAAAAKLGSPVVPGPWPTPIGLHSYGKPSSAGLPRASPPTRENAGTSPPTPRHWSSPRIG